jgi:hypothetical protein
MGHGNEQFLAMGTVHGFTDHDTATWRAEQLGSGRFEEVPFFGAARRCARELTLQHGLRDG